MANNFSFPEALDDATWVKSNSTITANAINAPDGTLTMDEIVAASGAGTASCEIRKVGSGVPTSTNMVYFGFFEPGTNLSWIRLFCAAYGTTAGISAFFDLSNGVVGATVGSDVVSTHIDLMPNGAYRCGVAFVSDPVSTAGSWRVRLANGDNDTNVSLDGTSSVHAWGLVLDTGTEPFTYTSEAAIDVPASSSTLAGIVSPRDSMPTDEARFQTFIDDSGITKTGDLTRDYRAALHSVLGLSGNDIDYDLPELFKRYNDSL